MDRFKELSQEEIDDMWNTRGTKEVKLVEKYIIFEGQEYKTIADASRKTGWSTSHIMRRRIKMVREVK